ncbi:unnamed protein product [Phyllotreta striolata]|uniref:Checkpoint protein n=1 Tax=Phyllotreta striolata TaxID=444603 RepID=A0A9N9XRQ3_PHYSR|nr:unnamed protein product [Phyllotreta striolata]
MKFRGLMTDSTAMREFMNITLSLSKFSKECVMRITNRRVYFIISAEKDAGPRRPLAWCELPVSFYFKEYKLVGVNEEYNEIYLEFSTVLLARSLAILKQNVKSCIIKLTNKQSPCLTLEMELDAEEISSQIVHDVPVEVISRKYWSNYEEPRFDDFHVTIQMPSLKSLRPIVERLKNLSNYLTVTANKNGRLTLQIKTTDVNLSVHFTDLSIQSFAGQLVTSDDDIEDSSNSQISSTIDIKKFLLFLAGLQINNTRVLCSIVHNKMVKLFIEQQGSLSIQVFLTETDYKK